ncbi:hypothetical protein Hamer_G026356 [Homarus americanus]|uniref:Uncharacterized protein n=1 Tax=Homarus americanus TaxID=6706 RepID=A0A8J5JKE8_HOMAM|nr:hypothetical protein Hamer_G026356 [Homarus americanus]
MGEHRHPQLYPNMILGAAGIYFGVGMICFKAFHHWIWPCRREPTFWVWSSRSSEEPRGKVVDKKQRKDGTENEIPLVGCLIHQTLNARGYGEWSQQFLSVLL